MYLDTVRPVYRAVVWCLQIYHKEQKTALILPLLNRKIKFLDRKPFKRNVLDYMCETFMEKIENTFGMELQKMKFKNIVRVLIVLSNYFHLFFPNLDRRFQPAIYKKAVIYYTFQVLSCLKTIFPNMWYIRCASNVYLIYQIPNKTFTVFVFWTNIIVLTWLSLHQ